MTPDEEWRPVVGYEGAYEVSSLGRVRSLPREGWAGGYLRRYAGRVMSLNTGDRYAKVQLHEAGIGVTKYVHHLVTQAFLGECPPGMEVCHNNGQHFDNRAANLRYGTHAENQQDLVTHGRHAFARRTHCNRGHALTPDNLAPVSTDRRRCLTCEKARSKRRWQERQTQSQGRS